MDNFITELQTTFFTIVENGAVIVLAALLIGYIAKKWIPDTTLQNKYIPTVNAIGGALLGIFIPHIFPGQGVIVCGIYGAACGVFASFVYDKIIDKE